MAAFNLFKVLRVDRMEIRHSNVLGWLLNPSETHGLGQLFCRRFLSRLLFQREFADVTLTAAQVELMPLGDVEVRREWSNIDVLVVSREGKWCLLIENKIGAKESSQSMKKYHDTVNREFHGFRILPVLLTITGEEPSETAQESGFVSMSHSEVLEIADQVIAQNEARIPGDIQVFLRHYLTTLRRLTMADKEFESLCKSIYRKHREAIELIIRYGTTSQVLETFEEQIPKLVECDFVQRAFGLVFFLPKSLANAIQGQKGDGRKVFPQISPVSCWFQHVKNKTPQRLHAAVEVGPFEDWDRRKALLEFLHDSGLTFNLKNALQPKKKKTRIASCGLDLQSVNGEPDMSDESVVDATRTLWKKLAPKVDKIVDLLRGFNWS